MSSPRRFRVWDGEEMHEPPHDFSIHGDGSLHIPVHIRMRPGRSHIEDGYQIMQYTGLTDAEGADIYEGDIIEKDTGRRVVMDAVYWDVDGWTWDGKALWLATNGVVTGNCYEDPDLVGKQA